MKSIAILQWIGLLLLSIPLKSVAQTENLYFEHLSPNPLPHTLVWSIYQDEEGFMWFGTYSGLVKYDGATTTIWKTDATDPDHVLRSNRIFNMHDDGQGDLWFPTEGGGLHQLNKRTGKVSVYPIDSLQATRWDVALSIFEDEQGMFWLSCGLGMARFDPATHEYTLHPSPDEQAIDFLQQDAQGRFWGVNQEGLWQFDPTTGEYTLLPLLSPNGNKLGANSLHLDAQGIAWVGTFGEGVFQVNIGQKSQEATPYHSGLVNKNIKRNGIYEANGYLWLATNQGLQCIDTKTNQIASYTSDPSLPGSLSNDNLILIYKDRMDNLWIGMFPGVNKASLQANPFYMHQIIPTPEPFRRDENVITSILEDHTGMVWVVSGAKGLYQFNPLTHQLTHVVVNPRDVNKELSNLHWPLYEDREGRLWVGGGTDKGLYLYNREKRIFTHYGCEMAVGSLDIDAAGKLWISGWSESIASFDPLTGQFTYYRPDENDTIGLFPGRIENILVSRTGEIWVSSTRGLSRLDPKTAKFTHYHPHYRTADEYMHDLGCLYEDKQGNLWIGSRGGGLSRFDPDTGRFTQFTTRDGLPGNRVTSIVSDEQHNLWIGTDKGLSCFTPATRTLRNFDTSDGLPTIPYFTESAHSRQGRLLFGTYNGFVIFHPDSIKDQKDAPPPVYITGFKVLEKSLPVPDSLIELPHDENFLSFEFVAINYNSFEKNQYAYQMERVNEDWVYSDTRRFASYPNLDPGKYVFRVKASNNDGIWNEEGASIQFVILPPWWQTWWAYILYGLLALGILWAIRHYELKRFKLRHRAEHLAEVDTLKSRFFANISHEFRTPLTLILGPVKQLMDKHTDQQDQNNLSGIQRNAQRLLHLVNQLLDLSKLEAGKLKLEAVKSDIVAFLKARAYAFTSLAEHKNIHFSVELPDEKIGAYFDRDKLEKIINNLLSNAFKFTAEGGSVRLKGQPITQGNKEWFQIQVVDSGKGIPEEETDKIFDRFYQVDSSQTREQEGTGIGLALTKELVELHHGEIKVESTPGEGTVFTLLLPLGRAHLKEAEIIQELPLPEEETESVEARIYPSEILISPSDILLEKEETKLETEKPMVLIVEDHQEVRRFIRDSITDQYQVREAENGKMGVAIAKDLLPDLIISDVMMPEMDGYQLCEKIKTDEITSHIPVILLTAKADRQSKLTGLETGADDYLAKPFDVEELLLIIRNHIEERRKMRERFSRDITLEPRSISITSLDEQFLTKVLDIIEEHMKNESFTIEALSQEAGYSNMHFYRKIKALSGQTPSQFLRTIRLKRAAALLQKKSDHVTQIAYSVGFSSLSYFNKCFKDQFGMTPTQFAAETQAQK